MLMVATSGVVALMANEHPSGDWPILQFIGVAVSEDYFFSNP